MTTRLTALLLLSAAAVAAAGQAPERSAPHDLSLWYRAPAAQALADDGAGSGAGETGGRTPSRPGPLS